MTLINYEINVILTLSETCVISYSTRAATFGIFDKKPDVPVITLSIQDNRKLLQQLKSGVMQAISWNKCQSKV